MEILTQSASETKSLGAKVASGLKPNNTKATVIAISGNLGSGKTTFVQGFAEGLGITTRIISPTFILMRSYKVENKEGFNTLYHLDLYRLEGDVKSQVLNLGFEEIIQDPKNIVLIEWAEKMENGFSWDTWIEFQRKTENERLVIMKDKI